MKSLCDATPRVVVDNDFRRQMYQDALDGDRKNVVQFQKKMDKIQADLAAAQ